MNIDELTVGQLREIAAWATNMNLCESASKAECSLPLGEKVLIRTVTHYYTGRVKKVTASDVVLSDAAWIASTGRFSDALRDGTLSEVEPYPDDVVVCRGAMVDFCLWKHPLPREQE